MPRWYKEAGVDNAFPFTYNGKVYYNQAAWDAYADAEDAAFRARDRPRARSRFFEDELGGARPQARRGWGIRDRVPFVAPRFVRPFNLADYQAAVRGGLQLRLRREIEARRQAAKARRGARIQQRRRWAIVRRELRRRG